MLMKRCCLGKKEGKLLSCKQTLQELLMRQRLYHKVTGHQIITISSVKFNINVDVRGQDAVHSQ